MDAAKASEVATLNIALKWRLAGLQRFTRYAEFGPTTSAPP